MSFITEFAQFTELGGGDVECTVIVQPDNLAHYLIPYVPFDKEVQVVYCSCSNTFEWEYTSGLFTNLEEMAIEEVVIIS